MGFFRSALQLHRLYHGLFAALLFSAVIPSASDAATVLFITRNNGSFNTDELQRTSLITSWGHTILPLYQSSSQAVFDAAVAQADVAYFSSQINSNLIGFNPATACVGSLLEEGGLTDEFGLSSTSGDYAYPTIYLVGSSHYITATLPGGAHTIFSPAERHHYLSGTIAPGAHLLSLDGTTKNYRVMVAVEIGGELYTGAPAIGRRVWLPWGPRNITFSNLTAIGELLLKRSIEWAAQANTCSRLTKRAFLPDGTALTSGTQLAAGTEVKFLIYINNTGNAQSDVSVQDILDPAFTYRPATLQIDNSLPNCASSPCPPATEAAVFALVNAAVIRSDDVNLDGVRFDGINTIDAGDQNVPGNGVININANSIWALLFSATLN
ncbi:MAG: hypothetical protein IBX47_11955 [Desulfuromonadales bacterium]|nr:hypothetical protein [Desulfuromonadales bacterium]